MTSVSGGARLTVFDVGEFPVRSLGRQSPEEPSELVRRGGAPRFAGRVRLRLARALFHLEV